MPSPTIGLSLQKTPSYSRDSPTIIADPGRLENGAGFEPRLLCSPSKPYLDKRKPGVDHHHLFPGWQQMEQVEDLSPKELDDLPFGAIQLDPEGRILSYNMAEAQISGRSRDEVIGKSFFEEIAPCTNVKEFAGRFREGVAKKDLNYVFPYLFDFRMAPTRVWVRLFYSDKTHTGWVFVTRQQDS